MSEAPVPTTDDVQFPVDNIADALPQLRRPFAAGAVKWKIQASWGRGNGPIDTALVVGYIDARLVSARLNKVVAGEWSEKPVRVADKPEALMYELTVFEQTHVDIGVAQGTGDDMRLKAVHSDALKRPAVRFGIGEYLYAMPQFKLTVTEDGENTTDGAPTIKRLSNGKVGRLYESHEAHLRTLYEKWLTDEGEAAFGKALDHGDAETGSVGEGTAVDEPEAAAAASEPLADDEAKALGEQARALRDKIREVDEDALPQQTFDNALTQREHSHDRLRDFVGNLTELLADVERFDVLKAEARGKLSEADAKKAIEKAQRRASRRERVEVLEKAIADGKPKGGDGDDK